MNIVFFGTSGFAVPSLKALAQSRHKVLLVVTQPDRKKGRNLALKPPVIKEIASSLDIPVFQPANASSPESVAQLKKPDADLFVVVSFGQILNQETLSIPKKFAINLHASLLPKYRGAAPINWAILNGEKKTGLTVFKLEKKMDSGDIILAKEFNIADDDNAVTLSEKLSLEGAKILVEAVDLIDKSECSFKRQDISFVSFAPKLKKADGLISWNIPAIELRNRIRGLLPWPGAFTVFKGKIIKVLAAATADAKDGEGLPGEIIGIENGLGILVKTKKGLLAIQQLQIEGSRPMGFEEFLHGHKVIPGAQFE